MPVELRPATEFSVAELASIFTAAYEEYVVPFVLDEPRLAYMVDVFDLELAQSVVAVDDGHAVGLANLGLRGDRAWLGGVGVVPVHRRVGLGELLTCTMLDHARAAGARELVLEVIVENAAAIRLYEKLGFVHIRELEVLTLAPSSNGPPAEHADLEDALGLVAARRDTPEPWQRDAATVANLARHPPAPQAVTNEGAAVVFRELDGVVSLLQAAGDPHDLRDLVVALRSRGRVTALNYPTDAAVTGVLHEAGAEVTVRQYEMVAALE